MNITYHRATADDIAVLADMRITFLTDLFGVQPAEAIDELKSSLLSYFKESIASGSYIGWLASSQNEVIGAGGLIVRVGPGSFSNPSGRVGYILNMYTTPRFRCKGISGRILELTQESARKAGIDNFELHATRMGESIYLRDGFAKHSEPTYRKFSS